MDGQYWIVNWFARWKVVIADGIVSVAPLWTDYLIGWSIGELIEFCALNHYTLEGPSDGR